MSAASVGSGAPSLVPSFAEEAKRRREGPFRFQTLPRVRSCLRPGAPWTRSLTASSGSATAATRACSWSPTDGAIAVDAPPTLGHGILRAMDRVTNKPVTHTVYSHHHSDHVGAMSIFPSHARCYAQRATAQRLALLGDPDWPLSTDVFDDVETIEAGDHTLRLSYPGPNHSEGNSFIYAPNQRVLMLVDVLFPGRVPFSNLALSAFVPGFIRLHELVLSYEFDSLVSGHVTRPGTSEDARVQLEYMDDLRATAEKPSRAWTWPA